MGRKTPSYLKGLAGNRARLASELQRLESLSADVAQALGAVRADLDACDRMIRLFDERLDPNEIKPITEWRHHRGKRGDLKALILEILQSAAPEPVDTAYIALRIQHRWQLTFVSAQDREDWLHGSVARQLRKLSAEGCLERLHDPRVPTGEAGRWRLKQHGAPSLAHLQAQVEAAGGSVQQCDDDPA